MLPDGTIPLQRRFGKGTEGQTGKMKAEVKLLIGRGSIAQDTGMGQGEKGMAKRKSGKIRVARRRVVKRRRPQKRASLFSIFCKLFG
jgi:hypothetical protein